jgi:hypothetical protein
MQPVRVQKLYSVVGAAGAACALLQGAKLVTVSTATISSDTGLGNCRQSPIRIALSFFAAFFLKPDWES